MKLRNRFAKSLGYKCFYDMKVTQAEGFDKVTLFGILDDLERQTRPILEKALANLKADKGEKALLPYNMGYALSGDISKLKVCMIYSCICFIPKYHLLVCLLYASATVRFSFDTK